MDKLDRLSGRVDQREADYRTVLINALQDCAGGRWGLFGQNDHTGFMKHPPELRELRDLASSINRLRARLSMPPFPLHEEFEVSRGRAGANDPGEAKLATEWLQRLAEA
jgi:hypothetical protein